MSKIEILDKIEKVVYITQPSPVILVSTTGKNKVDNVAPFAMFMNCSTNPTHMIAIAISPKTDTYKNIKETKEFIIGIPQENMLEKLYKAGGKFDKDISEFEKVKLTKYNSKQLECKRIQECVANIDCIYEKEIETGNHIIIIGKVIACDIDEDKYDKDKIKLRSNIPNIYHITSNKFMINGKLKEIGEK